MEQPLEYSQLFYNEVIYYLEQKWNRRLNDHERHCVIEGYRFGRMVETENEIKNFGGEINGLVQQMCSQRN